MSRSCHSATSSRAAWALPRSTRASPEICSLRDRVALVRHRARALLPGAKRLLQLAHLRALQVTDLGRQPLQARARQGDRLHELGVAIARDDLRGDILARQPQPLQHARLELGARRRIGADRARDRADGRLRERALQALCVAMRLERDARRA